MNNPSPANVAAPTGSNPFGGYQEEEEPPKQFTSKL
jgi:hypothetical protein